jgi:hypothetical protein
MPPLAARSGWPLVGKATCLKRGFFGNVQKSTSRTNAGKSHFQKEGSITVFGKVARLSARFDKGPEVT